MTAVPAAVRTSQQEQARWFDWLLYTWVDPLLRIGSQRMTRGEKLQHEDLLVVPEFEQPRVVAERLQAAWDAEIELAASKNRPPSLTRAIARTFWQRLLIGGICLLLSDTCLYAAPFVLRELIKWLDDKTQPIYLGFVYVIILTLCNWGMSIFLNASLHHNMTAFGQIATALQLMVFDKAMTLPANHGKTGFVSTLHATDTSQFNEIARFFHGVWVSPLLLIAAAVALYIFLGYAGLVAMGLMILFIPLQTVLMSKMAVMRKYIVDCTDRRMTATNEALQSIRVCKFMSWERRFFERITLERTAEVDMLGRSFTLRAVITTIMQSMPVLVTFTLFATVVGLGGSLEVKDVFPALSMLTLVRIPSMFIPMSIARMVRLSISIKRLSTFFLAPVQQQSHIAPPSVRLPEGVAVVLENITAVTETGLPLIDGSPVTRIEIPKGKLTVIIGATGSGKSTLLNAILGEVAVAPHSTVLVGGTASFVSQEPWILNTTVRGNIILNQPFDENRYNKVLQCCQLLTDLEQLPGGDETEIGERGIAVSGGQKQRIAIARAAYSDRSIFLADDLMSAVDAHVGQAIFDECIQGFLSDRTRILVTHRTKLVPHAALVIEVINGRITRAGAPTALFPDLQGGGDSSPSAESGGSPTTEQSPGPTPASTSAGGAAGSKSRGKLTQREEMHFGDVSWDVYLWYMRLGKFTLVAAGMALFTIWRASTVLTDMWLAIWSARDRAFGRSYTTNDYLMFFGIFSGATVVITFIRQQVYAAFMTEVSRSAHRALLTRVLGAPMWFFDVTPIGRLLNRFSRDIDGVDNKLSEVFQTVLILSFMIIGTLFTISFAAPWFLIVIPFLIVIFRGMFVFYSRTARGVKRLEGVSRSPVMAIMTEAVNGLATIRAYGVVDWFRDMHDHRSLLALRPVYSQRACQRWLSARTEMLGASVVFGAAYLAAMNRALSQSALNAGVDSAVAALSLSYALSTTNAITNLTRQLADLECEMSSAERVAEYSTGIPQEPDVVYDEPPPSNAEADSIRSVAAPPPGWPASGSIIFDNVSARYRPGLPLVLKGVSLTIPSGARVGVCGRTGSGKSTCLLALFRMIDVCDGQIAIDGVNIADVRLHDLRRIVTVMPQDPTLFAGSVRSNLDPFGEASDETLWNAIDGVGMGERLRSQGGLGGEVAERGANFSQGERQLLCLARAQLKQCRVLLADEASSNTDDETDTRIQRVIRENFENCTIVTIAHRLLTVADSDIIIMMDNGCVAEVGTPSELLANESSAFSAMARALGDVEYARVVALAAEASKTAA